MLSCCFLRIFHYIDKIKREVMLKNGGQNSKYLFDEFYNLCHQFFRTHPEKSNNTTIQCFMSYDTHIRIPFNF